MNVCFFRTIQTESYSCWILFNKENEAFLKVLCKRCPLWDVSVQFLFVNMCSAFRCLWVTCPQVETEHLTTRRRKSNRLSWEFGKLKGQDKWSTPSNEEIKEIPSDWWLVKESILHYTHEWFPWGFRVNPLHAFYLPFQIWMVVVTMIKHKSMTPKEKKIMYQIL